MNISDTIKAPRLYVEHDLNIGARVPMNDKQFHYLAHVMRAQDGMALRLFNGRDGEFMARFEKDGKKSGIGIIEEKLKDQPPKKNSIHLVFAPIKKHRLDILIEKAVELGCTDFYPVITAHTDIPKMNEDKITSQIIEAAEQCERLDMPRLRPVQKLESFLGGYDKNAFTLYALVERDEKASPIEKVFFENHTGFLIGPEGGFSENEKKMIAEHPDVAGLSLGQQIMRAETAAIYALSAAKLRSCSK